MRLHKKSEPFLFLLLPMVVYIAVVSIPIIFSVYYSFMDWNGISDMTFVGFRNYAKMFQDENLWICMINNLKYTVINVVYQVGIGLLMAILVERISKGNNLIRVLFFTPVIVSSMAMSQTFKKLLGINPDGVMNALLEAVGLGDHKVAFLASMEITLYVVAIVEAYKFSGLYLVVFHSAFTSVDTEVLEAARIDGANGFQVYNRIKLPLIKGIIISSVILVINGTLKAFEVPFILTNGGPGYTSELAATYMYKMSFINMDYGYGSALSILIVFECVVIIGIIMKLTQRAEKGGKK